MLRIGQVEATATQDGKYTDGSVAGGIAATRLRAAAFNAMQEELAHIVESAGLALDINDMTQVLKAIQKLTLSRANPFADIKSDGAAAISTALTNLGLGEGSALPVGVPVPWPSATPPTGWLKCNGAPFSAEEYPKLAKAYPKLKLPDLRGEFIRGWDDGRGVDSARLLLSSQAASILEHNHEMQGWTGNPLMASDVYSSMSSVFAVQLSIGDGGLLYSWKDGSGTTNDSKRMNRTNHVSSGAGDGSPRNIAFNYIVRAA
ncbi:phage tail protein [Escherichia coli]|uniref:phage tail protein n=1 Tax=Escherichia coli TaxID=562 RepID=UPI000FB1F0D9|nr:phage tail protein [Escherichia coli]EFE7580289.1 tail fiber protein [Escherichia coli]MCN8749197.1 phage tail protein [Escherichia coli]MKP14700.1 tail fiber protein [Escherichia coli]NZC56112.1 tail fiber protein [Escherichia coli]HCJ6176065.1 tail fiber protein [Escherichia coli]